MRVIAKKVQHEEFEPGTLYCIKDQGKYVFSLSNYSWSLTVKSMDQLEASMKYENSFQGFKEKLTQTMREMMKEI